MVTSSFKIMYHAGKQNAHSDTLAQRPRGDLSDVFKPQKERERIWKCFICLTIPWLILINTLFKPSVRYSICGSYTTLPRNYNSALLQSLSTSADVLPDSFVNDNDFGTSILSQLTESEIGEIQRVDQTIRHVMTQKQVYLPCRLSGAVDHSTLKQS